MTSKNVKITFIKAWKPLDSLSEGSFRRKIVYQIAITLCSETTNNIPIHTTLYKIVD